MAYQYSLIILLLLSASGFGQSYVYPSLGNPDRKSHQYPIANQFEHLAVADGLSNNSVSAIIQDRKGYMWFGTHEGVNRYDGATFTVFKPDPKQPTRGFQNGSITGLCEGEGDQIWAITEAGLHEIDSRTGVVTPHLIKAANANRWNNQISIYQDSQHLLWITTFAGLVKYEPNKHQFTLYPAPMADMPLKSMLVDRQQRFWVASHEGLYLFDLTTGRFTLVPAPGPARPQPSFLSFYLDAKDVLWMGTSNEGKSLYKLDLRQQPWQLAPYNPGGQLNPYIWRNTIHQDASGLVWVGTTNGLHAIDPLSDRVVTYQTNPDLAKGLASSNAQAVFHDRAGTLWVGTDNGIDRQAANTKPFTITRITPNERQTNRPENRVTALAVDRRNQLWTTNMESVYRQSTGQTKPDLIPPERLGSSTQHKNNVNTITPDGEDGVWFGTNDGLFHYDQGKDTYTNYPAPFPIQYLSVKYTDNVPTAELWVGGIGGIASFNRYTHKYSYYPYKPGAANGLTDNYINGLLASEDWTVWVLIKRMGLCRLDPKTGQFTRHMAGQKGQLSTNEVESIYEDKAGTLWVGTHRGGLNRRDRETGLFSVVRPKDGLPGSTILGITGDESGRLWLSTDKGLCRYDPATKASHNYEMSDGLPSNEFIQNAVFRRPDQLFFGSQDGLVRFKPNRIEDDMRPFPVYINGLTVLDKPRTIIDSVIRLNYDENMVSFSFAALAYDHPEQNQYAYQLTGVNPGWVENGNRHSVNYNSLLPGTYTFRVKAANSNGFWTPNMASVRVIIAPPWWATWWAYVLYALLAGGAIWGYIRFYTNRIKQRQELLLNRQQAEQLRAVDELKTRFFSNITHEFRTPLSLIIAPVDKLLQEGRFDRSTLLTVQRNAGQLSRLINQLLDLSKLEGNYMAVALVQGNVPTFVEQLVATFGRSAAHKAIALNCDTTGIPTHDYVFDADKWEKILTNLLSNALKFTKAGGTVTVTGTSVWMADGLAGVQVQVNDSGIGIAPDKLGHIFDRFYQADTSSTRAYEGTGIGLALVKELVELLEGTITVSSELGTGTSFVLTLPARRATATANVPRLEPIEADASSLNWLAPNSTTMTQQKNQEDNAQDLPRVLVVEDNDELREFLVAELSGTYQVLQAADGAAGWAIVQAELPDIVLTDLMMPGMDGIELTRLTKTAPDTDHIAVVILTAKAAQQSRLDGLQQGADEYLAKPFNIDELHLRLRNLVTRQQKLGEHYRQQLALPQPAAPDTVLPDPFLLRIYSLLDSHLDDPSISVEWLADQLAMGRKTLYRKVNALIQLPPGDLIRQYRLRKAADLLRSGHTVTETADLAGFSTPSHFSFAFKEFYQQTPSEFTGGQPKKA
ncbi:hybrid sensor histidine kinase/response regulator transcription factor [Fibrivirga algicola]|uniref:histidine kinase n=1 Tax=Fibrivirga algicola TaxID=2950420 RepID=A0ABX0QH83_9BACT|nr:two-component regulator propeller domain-containing protein [Fibrivirga algicola]NID10213.1 response regulator [Fibrivirga algicola]